MNGLITLPTFYNQFPQTNTITTTGSAKSHASSIQGTTVAIYEVGAALGACSCYFLGDALGRRRMITLAAVVVLLGVTIQASAFSLGQLIAARVVTGMLCNCFCRNW
jgi:MFS family permease